jgi:hypothetical protein
MEEHFAISHGPTRSQSKRYRKLLGDEAVDSFQVLLEAKSVRLIGELDHPVLHLRTMRGRVRTTAGVMVRKRAVTFAVTPV